MLCQAKMPNRGGPQTADMGLLGQTIAFDPTFGSFFGESVQTLQIGTDFFGVQSVDTVRKCTTSYLLAGVACL